MEYMLLIYDDPTAMPPPDSAEYGQVHEGWMRYTQAMHEAGVHRAGEALQAAGTATTVRAPEGRPLVVDGPFAETKEVLGGFYVLDVPDLDSALDWAGRAPHLAHGSVEVRPVMTFG